MDNSKYQIIADYVRQNPESSSTEILKGLNWDVSPATIRRYLGAMVADKKLIASGVNKGTRYRISPAYGILATIDVDTYFQKEIDERQIIDHFNFKLIDTLKDAPLFTTEEHNRLRKLQDQFTSNISKLSPSQYKKEMERLAVDLSWKSSQIEGNTYSLLETERLLMEKETASGKSLEEAKMLLNHKEALDYLIENPHYLQPLSVTKIENIHSILVEDLGVDRNIRNRRVGITGTNYRPLDNEFQIREALQETCDIVNAKTDIFEKALLLLVLISYIQPFNDGNKRTARIVSNAELMANNYCPISFRTIDSVEYKKAMLIFYEQNNISAFKKIFIDQFEFAVKTYF